MLSDERTRVTGPIIRLLGPGEDTELGVSKRRSGVIITITITKKTNKYPTPTTRWRINVQQDLCYDSEQILEHNT